MRKLHQKKIISTFSSSSLSLGLSLGFAACLLLGSCIQPPSLGDFLEDDAVQEKIASTRVDLSPASDAGLVVGNQRVSGLDPNKYYKIKTETLAEKKVEIKDEDDQVIGEKIEIVPGTPSYGFIKKDGNETEDLKEIERVTGRAINHLKNARTDNTLTSLSTYTTYTINAAVPFEHQLYYYENLEDSSDIDADPSLVRKPFPANGTIPAPDDGKFHFLDLGSFIRDVDADEDGVNDFTYDYFEYVSIVENGAPPVGVRTENIFRLSRAYLSVDYIFVEYNTDGEITNFKVLTVNFTGETQPDGTMFKFNIGYSSFSDENPLEDKIHASATGFLHSEGTKTINFTIDNTSGFFTDIEWYLDVEDAPVSTGLTYSMSFDINTTLNDYEIAGTYIIYVFALYGGALYEVKIEIEVSA